MHRYALRTLSRVKVVSYGKVRKPRGFHSGHSLKKKEFNENFAERCRSIDREIIYLDGLELNTTKHLLKKDVEKSKLIPVNMYCDINNKMTSDKHKEIIKKNEKELGINVKYEMIESVISKVDKPYGAIWLDYNCTWNGNDWGASPKNTFEKCISKCVDENTLFQITFCLRDNRLKGISHKDEIINIRNYIQFIVEAYGKDSMVINSDVYNKNMICFEIKVF
jgi:hypothetical protein